MDDELTYNDECIGNELILNKFGNNPIYGQLGNELIVAPTDTSTSSTETLDGHKRCRAHTFYLSDYYMHLMKEWCHLVDVDKLLKIYILGSNNFIWIIRRKIWVQWENGSLGTSWASSRK